MTRYFVYLCAELIVYLVSLFDLRKKTHDNCIDKLAHWNLKKKSVNISFVLFFSGEFTNDIFIN